MQIDADGLEQLLALAKERGTAEFWPTVAMQWIRAADAEIARLRNEVETLNRLDTDKG